MSDTGIAAKARFDFIRYAQVWEDADVLCAALAPKPGATLMSVCSAGDNALAMLTLDPARIVVADLSRAQLDCLRLRIAAYGQLSHAALLELMGSRPSSRRGELLDQLCRALPTSEQAFWAAQRGGVIAHGLGGIGKFERYFRIFRRWLLPLVHTRQTVDAVFEPRAADARRAFFETRWSNQRWALLLKLFFSTRVMGWLGRDPRFFDHAPGSLSAHVGRRVAHAAVALDPADNPYLHWILRGTHGTALPLALRAEHFDTIRQRLDRLDLRQGAFGAALAQGQRFDGFNLSDIFEYMAPAQFEVAYADILGCAAPDARLVYWNMLAPRRMPASLIDRVRRREADETALKAKDKAFFYSDFVIEAAIA